MAVESELSRVHKLVTEQGYAVTSERDIGLPAKCAKNLQETYFDSGRIRRHEGDIPVDRERARDVVYYEWHDGQLILEEYENIALCNRAEIKGKRVHQRIELLKDRQARDLIETFLRLVPEDRRQARGTFGVNLFRTHTDVVTKPHRDEEEFIILYVLDRDGDGAESYLYENDGQGPGVPEGSEPIFRQQLNPGELMIFEDSRFKHGATPLTHRSGGRARRDVFVCTVDYSTSYLEPAAASKRPAARLADAAAVM
jgi:2OG-Fe dioxygenase